MKAAFDELNLRVRELALQDACAVGILTAERGEQTAILGALEVLETSSSIDIVHTFTLPFESAEAWTLRTMLHLESDLRLRDAALAKEGVPAAPLPVECRSLRHAPVDRVARAIAHLATELEPLGYLVIAMLPTDVLPREEYASFVCELLERIDARRVRLLLREHPSDHLLRNALDASGIRYAQRRGGTSPRELEEQLHRDVQDESLSPLRRAQSLLQIGVLDLSNARLDEAYVRIGIASQLFQTLQARPLLPLALHALASVQFARGADVLEVTGLLTEAVRASRGVEGWMTLSLAGFDLGVLQHQVGQFAQSEASFEEAALAAKAVGNASLVARATMHLGDVSRSREQHAKARDLWATAAQLATTIADHAIAEEANRRLGVLYQQADLPHEANVHRCAAEEHAHAFRCELARAAEQVANTSA